MINLKLKFLSFVLSLPQKPRNKIISWIRNRGTHPKDSDIRGVPLLLLPGIRMYDLIAHDDISKAIEALGFHDWSHTKSIAKIADKNKKGLFVDVGANMGYFSLLWASIASSGRVLAYEASPKNIKIFEKNILQNHMEKKITLVPKALGDRNGTIGFYCGPEDQTGYGSICLDISDEIMQVPIVRLDEELPDEEIDYLKIDVEGADALVLYGCEKLLRRKRIKIIHFEQNLARMQHLGITSGDAPNFLKKMDYACYPLSKSEDEWIAYPNTN